MTPIWTVHRTPSTRFPFRVAIEQDGRVIIAVRAPSPWPGPGQQIFCLREDGSDPAESLEPVERVPVVSMTRVGRKLAIALDRPLRKRCEFLSVAKAYRNRDGTYEQIFFRTESGIRAHRSRTRLELQPKAVTLDVVVDSAERYPWRFPGARVTNRKLPVGDYALLDGERIAAVVERKSFDNLLGNLGAIQALHHHLAELARHTRSAVVIEAQYADFLNESRLAGRWPAAHVARALAELAVMHPSLPLIFAGNRKLANQWTYRFFVGCAGLADVQQLSLVREASTPYGEGAITPPIDEQVRLTVLGAKGGAFAIRDVVNRLDGVTLSRVRKVLQEMEREGKVRCLGRGRGPRWEVIDRDAVDVP